MAIGTALTVERCENGSWTRCAITRTTRAKKKPTSRLLKISLFVFVFVFVFVLVLLCLKVFAACANFWCRCSVCTVINGGLNHEDHEGHEGFGYKFLILNFVFFVSFVVNVRLFFVATLPR